MKTKFLAFLLIGAVLISACTATEEAPAAPAVEEETAMAETEPAEAMQAETDADVAMEEEVSFSADIWPVIEEEALDAHGGAGGVYLESYEDIMNYVVPGNPEESMLYQALTGNGHELMPPDGPLPEETIQLFYDWIAQGAQDN